MRAVARMDPENRCADLEKPDTKDDLVYDLRADAQNRQIQETERRVGARGCVCV